MRTTLKTFWLGPRQIAQLLGLPFHPKGAAVEAVSETSTGNQGKKPDAPAKVINAGPVSWHGRGKPPELIRLQFEPSETEVATIFDMFPSAKFLVTFSGKRIKRKEHL